MGHREAVRTEVTANQANPIGLTAKDPVLLVALPPPLPPHLMHHECATPSPAADSTALDLFAGPSTLMTVSQMNAVFCPSSDSGLTPGQGQLGLGHCLLLP